MSAPKKFFFDVWLSHGNTVYRGVPYEVVTDWLQQGRLLGEDRVRPAGTEQWFQITEVPTFSGYIPANSALRTDEKAEALEPLENPFSWSHPGEEEDADPDMIPLIDVSLVLLIFFMMTSTVAAISATIKVPSVEHGVEITANTKMIWVGLEWISDTTVTYIVRREGYDKKELSVDKGLTKEQALAKIGEILDNQSTSVPEVRIAAHVKVNFDLIKELQLEMDKYRDQGKITKVTAEVGEKKK
jgi:biopolymer transport protein ExbD